MESIPEEKHEKANSTEGITELVGKLAALEKKLYQSADGTALYGDLASTIEEIRGTLFELIIDLRTDDQLTYRKTVDILRQPQFDIDVPYEEDEYRDVLDRFQLGSTITYTYRFS